MIRIKQLTHQTTETHHLVSSNRTTPFIKHTFPVLRDTLGENNLATGCHLIEFTNGNDIVYLFNEIIPG